MKNRKLTFWKGFVALWLFSIFASLVVSCGASKKNKHKEREERSEVKSVRLGSVNRKTWTAEAEQKDVINLSDSEFGIYINKDVSRPRKWKHTDEQGNVTEGEMMPGDSLIFSSKSSTSDLSHSEKTETTDSSGVKREEDSKTDLKRRESEKQKEHKPQWLGRIMSGAIILIIAYFLIRLIRKKLNKYV